jgi:hypothetical protein
MKHSGHFSECLMTMVLPLFSHKITHCRPDLAGSAGSLLAGVATAGQETDGGRSCRAGGEPEAIAGA